jgi:hypothetical protein
MWVVKVWRASAVDGLLGHKFSWLGLDFRNASSSFCSVAAATGSYSYPSSSSKSQLGQDNLTNAIPLEEERGRRSNLSVEQETFRSG